MGRIYTGNQSLVTGEKQQNFQQQKQDNLRYLINQAGQQSCDFRRKFEFISIVSWEGKVEVVYLW